MASLTACQTCSPAEDLKSSSWDLGSENVRSMVDTEGPVELESSRGDRGGRQKSRFDRARDEEVL